jgi:hypothetical protein
MGDRTWRFGRHGKSMTFPPLKDVVPMVFKPPLIGEVAVAVRKMML